jgi:hypothetical protein
VESAFKGQPKLVNGSVFERYMRLRKKDDRAQAAQAAKWLAGQMGELF